MQVLQKKQQQKNTFETYVQNLNAAQTISKAPNQSVRNKMFSATKHVDLRREI